LGAALLVTVADWPAADRLATEAAHRAGVAVSRVAALTPRTFALTLACDSAAACQAAMARLASDHSFALEVRPDRRRTLSPRPTPPSSK
jgi:hypothetical protein